MSLTLLLEKSSLQNHSMSQLNVYYILGVQFRRHFVEEKVIFLTKIKYKTTSNLLYHAVQKVASDELAELQKLMQ